MPTDGGLTDLAATLADGQAVDWAALEAELGSEAERAIFRQLRVIAEIAELHRSLDGGESTPDDPLPVIQDPQSSGPDELPGPAGATPLESTDAPEGEPHDLGTWGPYRLLRSLGPGTLGRVVRATDHLHRDVVIRFLPSPSPPEVAVAFLATGQALARVRHPNAVEVYGAEQHDDQTGLVMEFVDGRSLDRVVEALVVHGRERPCPGMPAVVARLAGRVEQRLGIHRVGRAPVEVVASSGDGLRVVGDLVSDYVRATIKDGNGPVPRIPPLRVLAGVEAQTSNLDGRVEVEWTADQDRVAALENPSDGFTLVNASVAWRPWGRSNGTTLLLSANNIFDVEARRHASFTKDFVPLAGRDIRLSLRATF